MIDFSDLKIDYSGIPPLAFFPARDGEQLPCRFYPSESEKVLVLLHGSGWHSRYFYPLAEAISSQGHAKVITPDLRGHGENPKRRGDVDYIGQLDDDLADLLHFIRKKYAPKKVLIAGHSSGGGLALRFASGRYGKEADAYLFLGPYLAHNAPTVNQKSGWADAKLLKIIAISLLNAIGVHKFDHAVTVTFNLPPEYRDGTESLAYSHALIMSYGPKDYKNDLKKLQRPSCFMVGSEDEIMISSAFKEVLAGVTNAKLIILPGVTHLGVVVNKEAISAIASWVDEQ